MSVGYRMTGGITGGLRPKLLAVFLLASLLPLTLTGWMAARWISELVNDASRTRLTSSLEIKKNRLQQYLTHRQEEMDMLTNSTHLFYAQRLRELEAQRDFYGAMVQQHFRDLLRALELLAATEPLPGNLASIDWVFRDAGGTPAVITGAKGDRWRVLAEISRPWLNRFRGKYGFDNVYLISTKGNVVLTAIPETVLGRNLLKEDAFKNSGLGKLFANAQKKSSFQEFAPLDFLDNKPTAFMGTPIKSVKDGKIIGVLAVRFSPTVFQKIKSNSSETTKSVNFFLVGPDRSRYALTHASSKNQEVFTPKQTKLALEESTPEDVVSLLELMASDTEAGAAPHIVKQSASADGTPAPVVPLSIEQALLENVLGAGLVKGINGQSMLSAWAPLAIHPAIHPSIAVGSAPAANDHTWSVVAELPMAQFFSAKTKDSVPFYKKQMDLSGYYDFFLIQPDGEVFFSATQQSDFGTNMVNGKYAHTNLGKLVRQVLEKQVFGITDFSPYPPSNNEPAAFMAQPLMRKGKLAMVVALQLPLEAITAAMQREDGLGSADDAFLVGPDKRMRSDSILDPKNHSVIASFAGNITENGVNSEAVQAALAGKTGLLPGKNFAGGSILTAFSPLTLGNGITWVLLVETPFMEKVVPLRVIPWPLLLTAFSTIFLGIAIIWVVASAMRRAIFQCVAQLQPLYNGKLLVSTSKQLKASHRRDEFGLLANDISSVVEHWQQAVEKLRNSGKHAVLCGMELAEFGMAIPTNVSESCYASMADEEAAIKEVSIHTQQQIHNAQALEKLLGSVKHDALQGKKAIANVGTNAKEVADKTTEFVEIARQTNLLSMKAAIEVASEGKYGKKVSMIITDIRKLAERGRIVADEIGELAFGVVHMVESANTILTTFEPGMQKSIKLAQTIAVADTDQHDGIVHIHTIARQLGECIQKNTLILEKILPVSQKLSQKLALLQEDLTFFSLDNDVDEVMVQGGDMVSSVVEQEEQ